MLRELMFCVSLATIAGCSESSDASNAGSGGSSASAGTSSGGAATGGKAGTAGAASGAGGRAGSGGLAGSSGQAGSAGASGASGAGGGSNDYDPCPSEGTPCIVMPLGDSITDGVGSSGGGYRPELFHLALSDSTTITFEGSGSNGPDFVDGVAFPKHHEGHSGFTIQQIRDSIVTWVQTANPQIVTLMIGTNDMNMNLDVANAPARLGDLI
ncbi:MAG TPA: SGNH/GDSL hydrolase family protein, partial [Polyangiaceae bacterium]|nr:SGNH/GDSL hydrolase family protein [Polyangiaceae bacterium]